jgi:HEAT repeat protein
MKTQNDLDNETAEKNDLSELVRALESNDGMVRQHAREKLVQIGKPAVEPLGDALSSEHEQMRWEAAKALVDIADSRVAPALVERLRDEYFDVRWLAAEALVTLQEEAVPALLSALEIHSDSIRLRDGAHHVLKKIKNKRTQIVLGPVFEALDELEPELTLPHAVRAAMKALRDQTAVNSE